MSIEGISKGIGQLPGLLHPNKTNPSEVAQGAPSFGDMFSDAIKEVDQLQKTADNKIEGMLTGRDGATTHGAMIAIQKADIAFQLMTQIKTKIISAYQEVIRTQV